MKNTYQNSAERYDAYMTKKIGGFMTQVHINKMLDVPVTDSDRGVSININTYNFKVKEFDDEGNVVYILDASRKVKPDGFKKGFALILNADGTYTRISFENLKPEDSEKMKEYGFRIAFDNNGTLRCVEDLNRGYFIGYTYDSNLACAFGTNYTPFINNEPEEFDDGFLYRYFEEYQE